MVLILKNVTVMLKRLAVVHRKANMVDSCPYSRVKKFEVDRESRVFSGNKEWMIRPGILLQITDIWREPSIDLFASSLNHQVSCYVSLKPDPGAAFNDAFSITWDRQ